MSCRNGLLQIKFGNHPVPLLKRPELGEVAIVNHDRRFIGRLTESRDYCCRDPSTAEKNRRIPHSVAQASSAAFTSCSTSLSVWAVLMIQCRPLEGVM